MKNVLLVIAALLLAPMAANAAEYKEGVNYTVINNGPGTSKPEITEFFSFFCPHCYHFSKEVVPNLVKNLPKGVTFNQAHVEFIGREMGVEMSRAFAVAHQLNVDAKIEKALFSAIHEKKQHFVSRDDIRKVFIANGVDGKDFDAAADSFMVNAQMSKMKRDTENAQLTGVPSIVVNGKYRIENSSIKSYDDLVKIAYYLAQKK
ncbi:thiol:disulfide interchange protein DsbA/DsbL [Shewanella intestini]|uniref:Thiol:disulfide interchange protein n=1 Tax=Shewanella intestini TaxID=2017544 RepID=A0ABS5I2B0_9GAMM|nr:MULTISPECIES: thiol:disulfide interchange protein DsbA/DsbL [Shewanella]MBR9728173.1 thiol:disulfide interchange protein DsbA/DsbL [Shewanella intestini]MRG36644.1 thioredoxin domain-containing protein [Shewanella sp. XMDDZSB0408]